MNLCCFVILKNDHEYLDEWIRYHIELGLDHIFVFEDIDSDTHKAITDQYECVTLKRIDEILTYEVEKTLKLKSKQSSFQNYYMRNALLYIKANYDYDWCFALDDDEFITLDHGDLHEVMSRYTDYDGVVLYWKTYNANGHIQKPDYTKHSTFELYTEEIPADCRWSLLYSCKSVYNMHTFKLQNFMNMHYCNFRESKCCRTDFSDINFETRCYDTIYIRHYTTRSWEEYMHKVKVRKMMHPANRKISDFFVLNPEMNKYMY